MILELDGLAVGTDPCAALPPISAVAAPGRPGVVAVETESAPTVASLVAGGRMHPDAGRLLIDGEQDAEQVRHAVALVDTPGVAEPFGVMSVRRIIREELAFADHRASRHAVDTVLGELGLESWADTHVQHLPTALRVRLLAELALLRDGVEGLVVTSPERHGGAVAEWFAVLRDLADRGVTVLIVTSRAAAEVIGAMLDDARDHEPEPEPDATVDDRGVSSLPPVPAAPSSQESTRS